MKRLFIFGLGYTAQALAAALGDDWEIVGTTRSGTLPLSPSGRGMSRPSGGTLALGQMDRISVVKFEDSETITTALSSATHILSSVPPDNTPTLPDPVLRQYGDTLKSLNPLWLGYLSSTGVYGDTNGRWVDETSMVGGGRRTARTDCDLAWQQDRRSHVFRLPGIYGPGRSPLDRVRSGRGHRIIQTGHVFCRVHVADIAATLIASMKNPIPSIYNISDDEPASGSAVIEYACDLLGIRYPPLQSLDEAELSAMGRDFYAECRRVDNRKIKQRLGVRLAYPNYRQGLQACVDVTLPSRIHDGAAHTIR